MMPPPPPQTMIPDTFIVALIVTAVALGIWYMRKE